MTIDPNPRPEGGGRNIPLSSLRTFLTLLVVAHHAALAYHPYAPPPPTSLTAPPRLWMVFPIVDPQRWSRADLFVGFNDVFFMSLMFFISGVFAWPSLARRGASGFARERIIKLGIPFVVSAALLAPLAYYASYVQAGAGDGFAGFVRQWLSLGMWPAGPAWFLWVLLAFGLAAAALLSLAPDWGAALGRVSGRLSQRPIAYVVVLMAASAIVYVPMATLFTAERWSVAGPFAFQTSRLLHYAVYFFAGAGLGAYGVEQGLLARDGRLARRWVLWLLAAFVAFLFALVTLIVILSTLQNGGPGPILGAIGSLAFVVSCASTSLACLALFVRFSRHASGVWGSLAVNAYGIYLAHYFCVSWLQLSLVGVSLPGIAKVALVIIGAIGLSWGLSAALRQIPLVARVV